MHFTLIPPGEFEMGSTPEQIEQILADGRSRGLRQSYLDASQRETAHRVRITWPYYMGTYEVTNEQRRRMRLERPREGEPDDHPTGSSWTRLHSMIGSLTDMRDEVAAGRVYRLPTEAEWEYACRAGATTIYYTGDDLSSLAGHANIADAELKRAEPGRRFTVDWNDGFATTAPVGSFKPNAFGLYDMLGNVAEWCEDYRDLDYYLVSPPVDPTGPKTGRLRVARGGSWSSGINRCAHRGGFMPGFAGQNVGLRVVCEVPR